MKKYYLIAEYDRTADLYSVHVSDVAGPGRMILMEIEAESYSQAVRKVTFSASSMGKTAGRVYFFIQHFIHRHVKVCSDLGKPGIRDRLRLLGVQISVAEAQVLLQAGYGNPFSLADFADTLDMVHNSLLKDRNFPKFWLDI